MIIKLHDIFHAPEANSKIDPTGGKAIPVVGLDTHRAGVPAATANHLEPSPVRTMRIGG